MSRLATATFIEFTGNGLLMATALIYFTRHVHLPIEGVGLAMTTAQLIGIASATPVGYLGDLLKARNVLIAATATQGAATLSYLATSNLKAFFWVTCVVTVASQAANTARSAVVAAALTGARRVQGRARLRVTSNIGIGAGGVIGAATLQVDKTRGYLCVLAIAAISLLVSAAMVTRLPSKGPSRTPKGRVTARVVRDWKYIALAAGNAVISIHYGLFEVALPLWLISHTAIPRWIIGALFVVNTSLVVMLQVRASQRVTDVSSAADTLRAGGLLLLTACAMFGLAGTLRPLLALLCLLAASIVYVYGEMWHAAAIWELSYELADDQLHGQYQGAFHAAEGCGVAIAPIIATAIMLPYGAIGWAAAGLLIALAGAAVAQLAARGHDQPLSG